MELHDQAKSCSYEALICGRRLRSKRPTFFGGVPTIFIALLQAGGSTPTGWTSIKAIICGGAPLPPDVMRSFKKLSGQKVRQIYGSNETSPGATIMPARADEPETSVGLPLPGTRIEIRDANDPEKKVLPVSPAKS